MGARETPARRSRLDAWFVKRPGDNPWLDFLRTIAVMLVVLRHGIRVRLAGADTPLSAFDFVMLNGWIGVDLFFVLSGYLVGRNLMRERERNPQGYLGGYLVKRARRILPAYYVVLAVTVAGLFPLYAVDHNFLALRTTYHLLLLQDYLPSNINIVFWSLGVEAKFYLLVPILIVLLTRIRSPALLIGCIAALVLVSPVLRSITYIENGYPSDYLTYWPILRSPFHACLEPLLLGLAVALVEVRKGITLSPGKAKALLFLSLFAMLVWSASGDFMSEITFWDAAPQPALIAILFATAVLSAVGLAKVRLPAEPVFRVGSHLSYALYLVHFPLLPFSEVAAQRLGGSGLAFWAVYLGLSLAASLALHFLVEKPFLQRRQGENLPGRVLNHR